MVSPAGDRVELFEENAEQNRFRADAGHADGSNRHNEPLTAPIVPHHLHLTAAAVRSLNDFAARLAAAGITAERIPRDEWSSRAALRFIDPRGTFIEVVEAAR